MTILFAGTMEEKIYNRQVKKESLAGHLIDKQLFERNISKEDMELYDCTNLNQNLEEKPKMSFTPDEDKLLAAVLNNEVDRIWSVHKHDDLLQHQVDENLSEEEVQQAWQIFQQEEELKRLLPKKAQREMLDNLFAKPTKDHSTKNCVDKKHILCDRDTEYESKDETKTGSCARDDGTY